MNRNNKAKLILANGIVFNGYALGKRGQSCGEVCFNTGMTGYQEILTDPSYSGQLITMTYPHIGNYGINNDDIESNKIHAKGFIVKEACEAPSNYRSTSTLNKYLKKNHIIGIQGIDTRYLTRIIRDQGAMNAIISSNELDENKLKNKLKNHPSMQGLDLAKVVTCRKQYSWNKSNKGFKVAAIDYGITGDDPEVLQLLGEKLELIISKAPNISSTNVTSKSFETNIELDLNNSNMALSSKQMEAILNELAAANNGIIVGSMLDGNKDLPIRVKSLGKISSSIEGVGLLTLPGQASVDYVESFGKTSLTRTSEFIERKNGEKKNSVQGQIWTGTLASTVESSIKKEINEFEQSLPAGYSMYSDGEGDTAAQSQGQLISSAAIFFVLIVIGLVAALNSFTQAGIILSVAILCVGLSFVGLVVGQQNYGFIATVGAIGLAGLAINDSIVVLSHIKEEAEKGNMTKAQLVEVVIRSTRHVITTSATTIGGFLPLLFASIFFRPLAWGMVVGVLGSSIIAVFYIPAMFILLKKIKA